jgi:cob(I)alamin adenosyltransferase
MKIYTKTGDDGSTGLFGGGRVAKASDRVEAYGTVDELNAVLGLALASGLSPLSDAFLMLVQSELFTLGAELACEPGKEDKLRMTLLGPLDAERLEHAIDRAETELAPLQTFVLPGGTIQSSHLHVARTVCRRAERRTLTVEGVRKDVIIYLNRLSDLLFTLARYENATRKVADIPWLPKKD